MNNPSLHITDWVLARLRQNLPVADADFDCLFEDPWIRGHSSVHWTPVAAARKAVEWLALTSSSRVLDVGSGCGKFCLIGALMSQAHFVGVEQRASLVRAATSTARALGITSIEFVHGDMRSVDWSRFDAAYLYNPFAELLFDAPHDPVIDGGIKHSAALYADCVRFVEAKLDALPTGARLVTYNGFGGTVPSRFHLRRWERFDDCYLRLWTKEIVPRPPLSLVSDSGGMTNDSSGPEAA